MNTWNVHRESRNTRNWFRYETFIHHFEFKGFSTWGERDTISFYANFSIWTPPRVAPRRKLLASSENRLSSSKPKSQLTVFFQIPQILSASGHDVICVPGYFLSGVFIVTSLIVISTQSAREHLTNPCTKRKVLSLTKPKGKIYKTKSLRNYITRTLVWKWT